mmetsp:Transcript_4604/g.11634  ORF Transcript_4604/g.11634 Transcript_4604/m.11634 type:complete len:290 (-) Transcript_4604:160-1029(-)
MTLLAAPEANAASTMTAATSSREISPLAMVLPGASTSGALGGSPFSPAGRTMTYSTPLACRCFSPTSFSSSTPPNALVILKPGVSAAPMARPSVRMEEMSTTRLTPAALAASVRCTTPSLSTACAAAPILKGLPGTNPVHTMATSNPFICAARVPASAVTSKPASRPTPPASSPIFFAFSVERTAATTSTSPPRLRSSATTSTPVWPVAPITSTLGVEGGAGGASGETPSAATAGTSSSLAKAGRTNGWEMARAARAERAWRRDATAGEDAEEDSSFEEAEAEAEAERR